MSVDRLKCDRIDFGGFFAKSKKHKYNPFLDRYLQSVKRDMTYILGIRCVDGVLLMGDTKVTIDDGADFAYSKKIFKPFTSVVIGAAGASGLYKSFQDRLSYSVTKIEETERITSPEQFSVITENVIRQMHDVYGEDRHILRNLEILMAVRMGDTAELRRVTSYGFSEPVNDFKAIGHGEPYGTIFIKKLKPNTTMTMEQASLLGCFILKVIKETEIDKSVGFLDDFLPQVWHLPDIKYSNDLPPYQSDSEEITELYIEYRDKKYPIKELNNKEVQSLLNRVSHRVDEFNSFFDKGDFKLF